MSIRVPEPTVEYQSLNHCQCDFCNTRRAVNEKKWQVSQRALQLQHAKLRNGYGCTAASSKDVTHYTHEHNPTCFDPNYPEPVNQTALNADRLKRTKALDKLTTNPSASSQQGDIKDDALANSRDNLDKLERLLIAEHKARVKAQLEADKLASVNANGECTLQPQLFASDRNNAGVANTVTLDGPTYNDNNNSVNSHPFFSSTGDKKLTIHDAYELAHVCPVTPPVQCAASRKLQNTLNDLRAITSDPVNPCNRAALEQIMANTANGSTVDARALHDSVRNVNNTKTSKQTSGNNATQNEFGNTLAANRANMPHPYGAGVVWRQGKTKKSNNNNDTNNDATYILNCDDDSTTQLPPGAIAALSIQK